MRRGFFLDSPRGWLLGCPSRYAKTWLLVSLGIRPRMVVEVSLWISRGVVQTGIAGWDLVVPRWHPFLYRGWDVESAMVGTWLSQGGAPF